MELKDTLHELRKRNGLSQLELAERLNVSRQAISRWEVGSSVPSIENLTALSVLYNISINDLIGDYNAEVSPGKESGDGHSIEKKGVSIHNGKRLFLIVIAILFIATALIVFIFRPQTKTAIENTPVKEISDLYNDNVGKDPLEEGEIIPAD